MRVWPGDPRPTQVWSQRIEQGDAVDLSQWTLGSHTGTHVDAPSHFVAGAPDLEAVGLGPLVGPCRVVDLADADVAEVAAGDRLLFKTPRRRAEGVVGLQPAAARRLAAGGVRLVGIDALSIEPADSVAAGAPVHRLLLREGVVILEGLVLDAVAPGEYVLVALPLRLQHSEASPVRAILLPPQRSV